MSELKKFEERLQQLHKFTGLLHQQVGLMLEEVHASQQSNIVLEGSTSPEDRAIMEQQLAEIHKEMQEIPSVSSLVLEPFSGPKSLLVKYLSPSVVNGGKGFIKPNDSFKQYEDDVLRVPVNRVPEWPAGFYQDLETKETQLLVHLESDITLCFSGLPSQDGGIVQYTPLINGGVKEGYHLTNFKERFIAGNPFPLKVLADQLENALMKIMEEHGF